MLISFLDKGKAVSFPRQASIASNLVFSNPYTLGLKRFIPIVTGACCR
jgi:hypothetical protein